MERTLKPSTRWFDSCVNIDRSVIGMLSIASCSLVPLEIAVSSELRNGR